MAQGGIDFRKNKQICLNGYITMIMYLLHIFSVKNLTKISVDR